MNPLDRPSQKLTRILTSGVSLCAMLAAVSLGSVAFAQTADDTSGSTEVVVTGIKQSLAKSIAVKKRSNSIVEAVTAEDIGKLPDVSIAESLARLPGVAAQRVEGRAQALSIRGLGPRFSLTLLNGQEMVSTGDDRSFEYDQFPSELVSQALVYKTPDASLGSQGLSGTVDLRTVRPLDFHERKINISARYDVNSYGDLVPGSNSSGNRLSFSYIDQFADGKIGVALGVAHLDSPWQKKYFNPWDYGTPDDLWMNGTPHDALTFSGFEMGVASTDAQRDGVLGVIEFKPSDNYHGQVNVFHTDFTQTMDGRELIGVTALWMPGTDWGTLPAVTISGNSATVTSGLPFMTMRADNREDTLDAVSFTNEFKLGDWSANADLGFSKATRTEAVIESYAMPKDYLNYKVTLPTNFDDFGSMSSSFDFGNPANFQLAGAWWGPGGAVSQFEVNDEMKAVRLSAKRPVSFGIFSAFEAGVIYSERTKDMARKDTDYNLVGASMCYAGGDIPCAPLPSGFSIGKADVSFTGIPSVISFDAWDILQTSSYSKGAPGKRIDYNWSVEDKITTAFAKADLNFNMGIPFRGNLGVQVVSVDQASSGIYKDELGNYNPNTDGASYTDVLPSFNLIGNLDDTTLLRFGIAQAVARPNMIDMRAGISASVSPLDRLWYGGGGNPGLKSWHSTNFDISVEKYFSASSYISFNMFYKDIDRGIALKDIKYDFTGFANPSSVIPISSIGTLSTWANTVGGSVKGFELSGAVEGSVISPVLDGFGLMGSYSKTVVAAKIDPDTGEPVTGMLEGISKDVWTATFYYEKNGFQARFAERYRSGFSGKRHNAFKDVTDTIRPELVADAQVGYTFESGPMDGLSVLFQVNNVFDTPYLVTQTVSGSTIPKEHHEYGRQYMLGVSYKY